MNEVIDLLKCPGCHRRGTMSLTIRKKSAEAICEICGEMVTSRVPYPEKRGGPFNIPSITGRFYDG